jgi:hypothetical protein
MDSTARERNLLHEVLWSKDPRKLARLVLVEHPEFPWGDILRELTDDERERVVTALTLAV